MFKLSESGGTWTKTLLHNSKETDGANPEGALLLYKENLYGTTLTDGTSTCQYSGNNVSGCGVAFTLTP